MKRHYEVPAYREILGLTLLLCFTRVAYAQPDWEFQNPLPQGNDLRSVSFNDRTSGWAAGLRGTILHTDDGGLTWDIQDAGTSNNLYGAACLSPAIAVIVGEGGAIYRTADTGLTWNLVPGSTSNLLITLCFADENIGYAFTAYAPSGNEMLKTTDGGLNWTLSNTGINDQITNSWFANPDTGYLTIGGFSAGAVYRTEDGGATWQQQPVPTSYGLNAVYAEDTVAWAVGYNGVILKTINASADWISVNTGSIFEKDLYTVHFADNSLGFAAGMQGETKRSTDGGYTWTTIMSDFLQTKTMRCLRMTDGLFGYAVGEKGKMMKTENAGINWRHLDNALKPELWAVWFNDTLNGTVVGDSITSPGGWTDGKIYTTSDGGKSWVLRETTPNASYTGLHYASLSTGYAVGFNGSNGWVAKTTNGGSSWSASATANFRGRLWSVFFHDELNGVAVGDSGMALTTSDGGVTWTRRSTGTSEPLFFVWFSYGLLTGTPDDTGYLGYATGVSGTLLKSKDGGVSWSTETSPTSYSINGVFIVPRKAIWLAANSNEIYKATVPGVFVKQTLPSSTSGSWISIYATDENTACAAGAYGQLVWTEDGGATWIHQKRTANTLRAVHLENSAEGWIAGEAGTILHASEEVSTHESPALQMHYLTMNNCPNPFGARTTFHFILPEAGDVEVVVYDIHGRQMETLARTRLPSGEHSMEWDGTGFPAGIYFCLLKLKTADQAGGQFTKMRKLVLVN